MVQGIEGRRKRYVEVVARYREDGSVRPLSIAWADGRVFAVDKVLDVRQAASLKVGGVGLRFIVRVGGRTTCVFYENPRWFVEEIVPDRQPAEAVTGAWDECELDAWDEAWDAEAALEKRA